MLPNGIAATPNKGNIGLQLYWRTMRASGLRNISIQLRKGRAVAHTVHKLIPYNLRISFHFP